MSKSDSSGSPEDRSWDYLSGWGTNALCFLLGAATGIITARALGPLARGELAILLYFPGLIGAILPFALPYAASYLLSEGSWDRTQVAGAIFRLSVASGLVGSAGCVLLAPLILSEDSLQLGVQVAVLCMLAPAMVMNPVLYGIHRGQERFRWVNTMLVLAAVGNLLVLLVLHTFQVLTPFSLALGTLLVQWSLVGLNMRRQGIGLISRDVNWSVYRSAVAHGLRFFLPLSVVGLVAVADRAILIRASTLAEVGYYAVALAVAFPLSMATEVFAQIGFVEMAKTREEAASAALAVRRIRIAHAIGTVAALFLMPFVGIVVRVAFGAEYSPAVPAAQLLVGAMALRGLSKVLEHFLRARGHVRPGVTSGGVSLACLVVGGVLLSPGNGASGLALALVCAETAGMLVLILAYRTLYGVRAQELWGIRPAVIREMWMTIRSTFPVRSI